MLAVLLLAWCAAAQQPPVLPPAVDTKDEAFEKVDPYTKGDSAAMDRAGYVSFGPFLFAQGVKTQDVEEALGLQQVLWVETAHFKLGSTLKTYKFRGDQREEKRFKEELARLKPRFEKFTPPRGKLDPWLRVHLFALRLEELYADFQRRFSLTDGDFDVTKRAPGGPNFGTGAFLGMPNKFTVLLLEKESGLVRFGKRFLNQEPKAFVRWQLGGSMLLVVTGDGVRGFGYDLESAMTCMVLSEATHNLVDGFRGTWSSCPLWFKYGLAHGVSRRIDERWTISALGTTREFGDDSWKWEPRLARLLANGFVKEWDDILGWAKWDDIKPQGHMLAWSRVEWLLENEACDPRALLVELCAPATNLDDSTRGAFYVQRSRTALEKACGRTLAELDAAWREHVARTYPK
ncbi:MAG: hypothetical protein IPJ77_23825 [Planctomycetes bacterium]|nr:hypothetical protein [Planctomycetota bacterium]